MLSVQFEQKDDDISVLELNVTLPEAEEGKDVKEAKPAEQ
jgi:cell division topological specificity factor